MLTHLVVIHSYIYSCVQAILLLQGESDTFGLYLYLFQLHPVDISMGITTYTSQAPPPHIQFTQG